MGDRRRVRILWQNEHYPDPVKGGGGAINTHYIVSALKRMGHEAVVLARGPEGCLPFREDIDGVTVQRMAPPELPERLWPLWPLLESRYVINSMASLIKPFDAYMGIDSWFALAVKKLYPEKPLVYRVEGNQKTHDLAVTANENSTLNSKIGRRRRYLRRLLSAENEFIEQRAWRACDAIVVKSEFMKRELQKFYNISFGKIHVVPNGVDYERFAKATATDEVLVRLDNMSHSKVVILFCGRLVGMKNVSFLLRAFAKMKHKEQAILAILGEGEQRMFLEKEAHRLEIATQTRFLGHSDRVEAFMAASDIFVLPSVYEPFGNALLEAMAAGLPCIALRPDSAKIRTAANEILDDQESGFLVSGDFHEELATKLDLLADNRELRSRIGRVGQAICQARYDWRKCASQYLSIILARGTRTSRMYC